MRIFLGGAGLFAYCLIAALPVQASEPYMLYRNAYQIGFVDGVGLACRQAANTPRPQLVNTLQEILPEWATEGVITNLAIADYVGDGQSAGVDWLFSQLGYSSEDEILAACERNVIVHDKIDLILERSPRQLINIPIEDLVIGS